MDISKKQDVFFDQLKLIQELAVVTALSESKENSNLGDILYLASYETLYRVLELIDGYFTNDIKLDLVDKETGISMRENIELHDKCVDYLRS